MNNEAETWIAIIGVSVVALIVAISYYFSYPAKVMEEMAKRSLRSQSDITEVIRGDEAVAVFTGGERRNLATVVWRDKLIQKQDLNKSRLVGEWVGERSKEVGKGLLDGLFKKGKH